MPSDAACGQYNLVDHPQLGPGEIAVSHRADPAIEPAGAWTEDLVLRLRELWSQGLTASQIAAALPGFSRNAILGKVHRLNLSSRPSPIQRDLPPKPTLMTLREHMCKWPIGEPGTPDFHFCGDETVANSPYCAEHHSRAYVPSRKQVA
jgi:GcrA cell cycle regulator